MENSSTIAKCNCDLASSQCKQSVSEQSKVLQQLEATEQLQDTKHVPFGDITLTDAERQRCEIWTRVMGYYRPTDSFNIGKKQEADERKYFKPVCDTELQRHSLSQKSDNANLDHADSEELEIQIQRTCPDCVTRAA